MSEGVTELINDEAVYRTAPATPVLLKSKVHPLFQYMYLLLQTLLLVL